MNHGNTYFWFSWQLFLRRGSFPQGCSKRLIVSLPISAPTSARWLEYGHPLPPRNPLACPITFAKAFTMGQKGMSIPPSVEGCEGFSSTCSTSTVQCSPACPTRPGNFKGTLTQLFQRRSDLGRDGRLRVAPERETPSHQSPPASAQFRRMEKDRSIVAGQASGICGGNARPHSSQRVFVGAGTITDKNTLLPKSKLSTVR
jgi:hypothetical protein